MSEVDALVIGAGIAGLEVSRRLLPYFPKLKIIAPEFFGGATAASQGVSSIKGLSSGRTALFSSKVEGHYRVKNWLGELAYFLGRPISSSEGGWEVFLNPEDFARKMDRAYHQKFLGLTRASIQPFHRLPVEIKKIIPETSIGALHYPHDIHFSLSDLKQAYEKAIGRHFIRDSVEQISIREQYLEVLTSAKLHLKPKHIIIAAGIDSMRLSAPFAQISLRPCLGQTMDMKLSSGSQDVLVIDGKNTISLINNSLSIGSTSAMLDRGEQISPPEAEVLLTEKLHSLLPRLQVEQIGLKQGIRALTQDRNPLVGELSRTVKGNTISLMTGFYKSGYQLIHEAVDSIVTNLQKEK